MLSLSARDRAITEEVGEIILKAIAVADNGTAVARRIGVLATRERNRGRGPARSGHPFDGICEESGAPLSWKDAVLDEQDPELGYEGRVRWVCPRANNSGLRSCGVC